VNRRVRLVDAGVADAAALAAAGSRLFVQAYGRYSRADDVAAHVQRYFGQETVTGELQKLNVSYTIA
jgi:hypothetical protein